MPWRQVLSLSCSFFTKTDFKTDFRYFVEYCVGFGVLIRTLALRLLMLSLRHSKLCTLTHGATGERSSIRSFHLSIYIYIWLLYIGVYRTGTMAIIGVSARPLASVPEMQMNVFLSASWWSAVSFLRWNFINITCWAAAATTITNISVSSCHFHVELLLFLIFTRPQRTCMEIVLHILVYPHIKYICHNYLKEFRFLQCRPESPRAHCIFYPRCTYGN